jgi:hypothetical protein
VVRAHAIGSGDAARGRVRSVDLWTNHCGGKCVNSSLRIRLTGRFFPSSVGFKKGRSYAGDYTQWNEVHIYKEDFSDAMKIIWPT